MFYFFASLIIVLAISLIYRDKTLPVFVGALASFVPFYGIDILMSIIGVAIAAIILIN